MQLRIETAKPVALESNDHLYPAGTAWDNSTSAGFNRKLFALIGKPRLLDIGCAGGGLVRSVIDDGGFAVGVEGSDYSKRTGRAEWAAIPSALFTADVTEPFQLFDGEDPLSFNVVTAWEFFEHIAQDRVSDVLGNLKRHLAPAGVVVASISTITSISNGIEYHQTVQPEEWWLEKFASEGLVEDTLLRDYFDPDWVRGPINGCDWSLCTTFRLQ